MQISNPWLVVGITVFTLFANAALAYFNLPGSLACTLQNAAPQTQAAAAALIGK